MKFLRANVASWAPAAVFFILYMVFGFMFKGFLEPRVGFHIVSDNAFLGVTAIGLTFVILTGGIDLSVGSVVGLSGILLGWLVTKHNMHPALAIALVIGLGTLIGLGQGLLIAKFEIAPFLVTLGGLFFARGLALVTSQESIDIQHPWFKNLGLFSLPLFSGASLTLGSIIFLLMAVAGTLVLRYTVWGRTVYAIGGNRASAVLMGLRVDRTTVGVYALSGFCAALGGVLFSLYTLSGNAVAATGLELDAIAAAVIGGTLLSGGYGSVLGTVVGVMILGTIQTAITFQGTLSSWWTKIVIGFLLLVFILLQKAVVHWQPKAR
ncbi:MAG: galactofuranose ABC transporter, permease protein YjfF [Armatimonadota bacterium]